MAPAGHTIADPETLLGQLQRGLGTGARAAMAAGAPAIPVVLEAFATDPRWDQFDERAEYYAALVETLPIDVKEVAQLLTTFNARVPEEERSAARRPMPLEVLARLVQIGSAEAVEALRREAADGDYCVDAVTALTNGPELDPLPGWEARVHGLADAIAARPPGWISDGGKSVSDDDSPWREWAAVHPEIRAAFDRAQERRATADNQRTRPPDLSKMSTAELLDHPHPNHWRRVSIELSKRTAIGDTNLQLAAADDVGLPMRAAAIRALAVRGHEPVLPIVLTLSDKTSPDHVAASMRSTLSRFPIGLTSTVACEWLADGDNWTRRRAAASVFATHGAGQHHALVAMALSRELDLEPEGDQYFICDLVRALGSAPQHGPFPGISRAFRVMRFSYGRSWVAETIANTDPTFKRTLAVDCLWDAERETRRIGAEAVSMDIPEAASRITALAADPFEHPEVREAASVRLRASGGLAT